MLLVRVDGLELLADREERDEAASPPATMRDEDAERPRDEDDCVEFWLGTLLSTTLDAVTEFCTELCCWLDACACTVDSGGG